MLKGSTGKETISQLLSVSQEIGEEAKYHLHKFEPDALIVANCDRLAETPDFPLETENIATSFVVYHFLSYGNPTFPLSYLSDP